MKSFVAALSVLFISFMALSAYSLDADSETPAAMNADAGMTPDSGTSGVGYTP